jgi:hypothetical protein
MILDKKLKIESVWILKKKNLKLSKNVFFLGGVVRHGSFLGVVYSEV